MCQRIVIGQEALFLMKSEENKIYQTFENLTTWTETRPRVGKYRKQRFHYGQYKYFIKYIFSSFLKLRNLVLLS